MRATHKTMRTLAALGVLEREQGRWRLEAWSANGCQRRFVNLRNGFRVTINKPLEEWDSDTPVVGYQVPPWDGSLD